MKTKKCINPECNCNDQKQEHNFCYACGNELVVDIINIEDFQDYPDDFQNYEKF